MQLSQAILDVLQVAPRVLQVALAVAILRRGWYRELPFFFTYTVEELVQASVLVPLYNRPNHGYPAYFYLGWSFIACSTALRFGIVYEVFQNLVKPYHGFQLLAQKCMRWSLLGLLVLAIIAAPYAPTSDSIAILRQLLVLKTILTGVQCGLIVVVFVLASYFHLAWPHRLFGVALGLAMYVSLALAITALRSQMGMMSNLTIDYAEAIGYDCAIGIWAYYLLVPEQAQTKPPSVPPHDLEKWNQELQRLLQR